MKKLTNFLRIGVICIFLLFCGCISESQNNNSNFGVVSENNQLSKSNSNFISSNSSLEHFLTTHEHFEAKIIKVMDGDTVYAMALNWSKYKIRLLGVDTPETYKKNRPDEYILLDGTPITDLQWLKEWGLKAKDFAKMNLENKIVIIVFDNIAPKKGYYGRYLAYIFINNSGNLEDFNKELLLNGYARVYVSKFEKLEEYQQAEYFAKSHYIGLWSWKKSESNQNNTISNTNVNLAIIYIHANAAGNDNYNLNDEYITIKNIGNTPIDLTGWRIQDAAGHCYMFPNGFILQPGATVTLHSGSGKDSTTDLYWNSKYAIWNNDGDTIYIINPAGKVVLTKSYGNT